MAVEGGGAEEDLAAKLEGTTIAEKDEEVAPSTTIPTDATGAPSLTALAAKAVAASGADPKELADEGCVLSSRAAAASPLPLLII